MLKNKILQQLQINAHTHHDNGYVPHFKANLLSTILPEDFEDDLRQGSGNELNTKFKALHSSSALCVNFFGFFKRHLQDFTLFGEGNFHTAKFEKKLPTGLKGTPPNLDFYLENDNCILGIESKFLETLDPKKPSFSAAYSDSFLHDLGNGLAEVVNRYRDCNQRMYLDAAQLLKHTMGLLNNKGSKQAKLVYVYWEPLNAKQFNEYVQHREELAEFSEQIKSVDGVSFYALSYCELAQKFKDHAVFTEHLANFGSRYFLGK